MLNYEKFKKGLVINISRKIKTVVIIFAVFVVLILVYNLLAPRLSIYNKVKSQFSGSGSSATKLLPEKRDVKAFSDFSGFTAIKVSVFEFSSPWGELSEESDIKEKNNAYEFDFENGVSMLVRDKSEKSTADSYIRSSTPDERQAVMNVYGDDIYDDHFELSELALGLTPGDVSLLSSVNEITAKGVLLRYKLFMPLNNISSIYTFQLDNTKGFQFGNPDNNDTVQIMLFDSQGNEYLISFAGGKINQDDVDLILRSIKFK